MHDVLKTVEQKTLNTCKRKIKKLKCCDGLKGDGLIAGVQAGLENACFADMCTDMKARPRKCDDTAMAEYGEIVLRNQDTDGDCFLPSNMFPRDGKELQVQDIDMIMKDNQATVDVGGPV